MKWSKCKQCGSTKDESYPNCFHCSYCGTKQCVFEYYERVRDNINGQTKESNPTRKNN